MPRGTDPFIAEKNLEVNAPIWLYRIDTDGNPANDLLLAEWDVDVVYPASGGDLYQAFPVTHSGLESSSDGKVDVVEVTVANVTRYIQSYLESSDGLRNRKVVIKQVFSDLLADAAAYIEDTFYVKSVTVTDAAAVFRLSSKLDILKVRLPLRRYARNHCQWTYKGYGCWTATGSGGAYVAPSGFEAAKQRLMAEDVVVTGGDVALYGVQQDRQANQVQTDRAEKVFDAVDCTGLGVGDGVLVIDLKCSDPARLTSNGQLELSSSASADTNEWYYSDLTGLSGDELSGKSVTTAWQTMEIPLSAFSATAPAPTVSAMKRVSWYNFQSAPCSIHWRNAMVRWGATDLSIAERYFDRAVDCRGLDITAGDQYLFIDLRVSDPLDMSEASGEFSQLEIGSDVPDTNEIYISALGDNMGVTGGYGAVGTTITASWQTFQIALSDFTEVGTFDIRAVSRIRWYQYGSAPLAVYFRNAFFSTADACDHTLRNCKAHQNSERFGGFPSVPFRNLAIS